jgi:hypothetical protein
VAVSRQEEVTRRLVSICPPELRAVYFRDPQSWRQVMLAILRGGAEARVAEIRAELATLRRSDPADLDQAVRLTVELADLEVALGPSRAEGT